MTSTDAATHIRAEADRLAALGERAPRQARDPVNAAMVNNWTEALADTNPVYTDREFAERSVHGGPVAPPAMMQAWTMPGLHGTRDDDDPLGVMMAVLDELGYTSVVATDSEQTYHRYLHHGERLTATTEMESVVGPKHTGLGEGWFVTTRTRWYVGDELVADMMFKVLKFSPGGAAPEPETRDSKIIDAGERAAATMRPVVSVDTAFFWEGTRQGELRIQRWGDTLRHPPGPMPPDGDLTAEADYVVAAGTGTVYSYVVHHHPRIPGKTTPFVIALVELDEGVRVMGELVDAGPDSVEIGLEVEAVFLRVDEELTLPAWRVRQ